MSINNSISGNLRISADNIIVHKAASICFMHDKAKLDEFKSIIPKKKAKPKSTPKIKLFLCENIFLDFSS